MDDDVLARLIAALHPDHVVRSADAFASPRAIADLVAPDLTDDPVFEALPGGRPTFGFQSGAFWFHMVVEDRDPSHFGRLLAPQYPLTQKIE